MLLFLFNCLLPCVTLPCKIASAFYIEATVNGMDMQLRNAAFVESMTELYNRQPFESVDILWFFMVILRIASLRPR